MAIIIELFEAAAAAALLTSTATIRRGRQKNEGGKVAGRGWVLRGFFFANKTKLAVQLQLSRDLSRARERYHSYSNSTSFNAYYPPISTHRTLEQSTMAMEEEALN